MHRGILYIATGRRYTAEAAGSARSAKAHMPELPVGLLCDDVASAKTTEIDFVAGLPTPTHSLLDKVVGLPQSPFERTLFLDTDTLVIEPVHELFQLLDHFDLAAAHAPWRWVRPVDACPECFPELNSGVLLFRRTPNLLRFFARWEALYREQLAAPRKPPHDQPAFRQALYESDLRFTILPPEYNLRTPFPAFAGGNAQVKILHGRGPSLDQAS